MADITFVMDSSGSIGKSRWALEKKFIERVIRSFAISETGTRVAAVFFNDKAYLGFGFERFISPDARSQIASTLSKIEYQRGLTDIGNALKFVRLVLLPDMRKGKRVSRIVVLITDAQNDRGNNALKEADRLRAQGVSVYMIALGRQEDK